MNESVEVKNEELKLLTPIETYFTLLKGMVCSGFLYLPRAFVRGGWVYMSVVLVCVSVLSTYSMLLSLEARKKLKATSLPDLAYKTYGRCGKFVLDVILVCSQSAFTISIIYFINLNITPLIFGHHSNAKKAVLISSSKDGKTTTITEIKSKVIRHGNGSNYMIKKPMNPVSLKYFDEKWEKYVIPTVCFILFSLLMFVRRIEVFASTHVFGDAMIFITILIIFAEGIVKMTRDGSLLSHIDYFIPDHFSIPIGISLVSLEGAGIIFPV